MYILYLNPMRGNAEVHKPVARAETREALEAFVETESVEAYRDGHWLKRFRKGGPLEWFNPPIEGNPFCNHYSDIGTLDDWLDNTRRDWHQMLSEVLEVDVS